VNETDIEELGANEQLVLDRSFQSALREKRVRNVVLSAGLTLTGVALFALYGVGTTAITAMSLLIVAVSAVEKVTYAREILVYKSLVRSLVHKLEGLQHLEPTPLDGHPAARARLRARRAEPHA
jgi:hypothetical protein